MFGLGLNSTYGMYNIDFLGGTSATLLVAIATRLLVGIAWFRMFQRVGIKPYLAFVPIVGEYQAFRMVWDDFSFAAIFSCTTFVAFIDSLGVQHPIIRACAVINFVMWWLVALLTSRAFQVNYIVGFLYGGVSWLGALLMAFWPAGSYIGPWSSDPEADQNVSAKERKKRRKKQAKAAKASKGK